MWHSCARARSDLCAETAKGIIRRLKYCVKVMLDIGKAVNATRAVRLGRVWVILK